MPAPAPHTPPCVLPTGIEDKGAIAVANGLLAGGSTRLTVRVVQGGGGGTSWVGVSGVCWSAGGCADEAPWAVALRLCCPVHCVRGRRALERCLNSARWRVAVCAMCESECACCCCGWLQEVDLSANDISGEGVDRVRELLNGLPTASTCRVNLEDNDDGSGSDDDN